MNGDGKVDGTYALLRRPRWQVWLPLLLLLLHAIALWHEEPHDDAYISFRYAKNWAEGRGLVFNPGERVEGYTNFLWTLILAFGARVGADPVVASQVLGVACAIGVLLLVGYGGGFRAALLLAAASPFAFYLSSGLETSLFTLLTWGGIEAFVSRRRGLAGFLLGLSAMTRPEGVIFFTFLLLYDIVDRRRIGRGLLTLALPFLLLFGGHMLWRFAYYGSFLPNTYYAKVTGGSLWSDLDLGGRYLWAFASSFLLLPLPLWIYARIDRHRAPRVRIALGIFLLYTLYVVVEGGDHMRFHRFFVPVLPPLVIVTAAAWERVATRLRGKGRVFFLLIPLSWIAASIPSGAYFERTHTPSLDAYVGQQLHKRIPREAWITCASCGKIPYFAGNPAIDLLGLTDRVIAHLPAHTEVRMKGHQKFSADYVLSRRPDYILIYDIMDRPYRDARTTPFTPDLFPWYLDILKHPRLKRDYALTSIPLDNGQFLICFKRRDAS